MLVKKESNGTVTIDGKNTITVSLNKAAFSFVGESKINFRNHTILGINKEKNKTLFSLFISKIKIMRSIWRFITMENIEDACLRFKAGDLITVDGFKAEVRQVNVGNYFFSFEDDQNTILVLSFLESEDTDRVKFYV